MELELTEKQVKEIRILRRKAIRRRQVLVLLLIAAVLIVFFCALGLHFSVFYTLIPIFFLTVVVLLGIRASRRAMAWEKKISEAGKKSKNKSAIRFETADVETAIIPAQDEVRFRLTPSDSDIRSLNMNAFNQENFVPTEKKERDLEKADLV